MASLWQKTLFYLGLVDEEQAEQIAASQERASQAEVRTVEPPAPVRRRPETPSQPAPVVRPPGVVAGRRVEPPTQTRRRMSDDPQHAEAGVMVHAPGSPHLQPLPAPGHGESEVIVARSFTDAQLLADHIRSGRPVVLDLRSTEPEMVRRLVDFSSGLTYALDGKMVKIGQGVILVSPPHITISVNEQRRLSELGLYQRSIAG